MSVAPRPLQTRPARHRPPFVLTVVLVFAAASVAVALLARYDVFDRSPASNSVQGSGVAATQTRVVGAFSGVVLAGSNAVVVRVGGRQSVVVHADDNLLRYVTTTVQAGNLVIGNRSGSFSTSSPMLVEVNVPSLEALTLAGSGILRASGSAGRLDVSLSGSGDAQLGQLVARNVHAVVSGSGRIVVTATHSFEGLVSGSGAIFYGGDPAHVKTSVTGSGVVARG
jgi:Putative auto-transporter adhesin, head GIN domain